ncbi:MAG TPA: hypothetical protein VN281_14865 [Verrucomicrobiae bacterium]|jgi:hypothetical protein|nr:hypothetical protein [Verrucomicrobiae bacterium]
MSSTLPSPLSPLRCSLVIHVRHSGQGYVARAANGVTASNTGSAFKAVAKVALKSKLGIKKVAYATQSRLEQEGIAVEQITQSIHASTWLVEWPEAK